MLLCRVWTTTTTAKFARVNIVRGHNILPSVLACLNRKLNLLVKVAVVAIGWRVVRSTTKIQGLGA